MGAATKSLRKSGGERAHNDDGDPLLTKGRDNNLDAARESATSAGSCACAYAPTMSRSPPPDHRGTLAGKNIIVYGNGTHSSVDEVKTWLRRQPLWALLRAFGALSHHLESRDENIPLIGNAPVSVHMVAQAAWLAAQASNDFRIPKRPVDGPYLEKLFDLLHRLPDLISLTEGEDRALEYMVRSGDHQFTYQAELRHQVPRVLLILTELWTESSQASALDPLHDVVALTGISLEELVLIGLSLLGGTKGGLLEPYRGLSDVRDGPLRDVFVHPKLEAFVRWCSADYTTLRTAKVRAPDAAHERFAFNPLRMFPLVRPDVTPPGLSRDGLVLPVWRTLYEKMTFGVFHMLADHHNRGRGDNPFRNAFGFVFQNYVGRLLAEGLGTGTALPEWRYVGAAGECDTPDWLILDGDRLTIIEVKATGLGLKTRMFGNLDDLRADLKKLARALRQFRRFIDDIAARRSGLESVVAAREFECVIVTFDRMFFANSVIRDELQRVAAAEGVDPLPHVHLVPVEDFEYFVGAGSAASVFDALRDKRTNAETDQMDFHDWLGRRFGRRAPSNPFLKRWHDQFLGRYGLPPVRDTNDESEGRPTAT
jgi:hypothetical protein